MKKTYFLSITALLFLISGCGAKSPPKPSALLFNGDKPATEPMDFKWRKDVNWVTDILSRNVVVKITPISLCNYFYDEEKCIDKVHYTHWKNTPIKGYLRLDTKIKYNEYTKHTYEQATQVKKFIKDLDLTDPKNTFVVKVISKSKFKIDGSPKLPATRITTTIFPKIVNHKGYQYLDIDEGLLKTLRVDPQGYYIDGYLKVPLTGKTKSKYNELRIPIEWGLDYERTSKNKEWGDITEKRSELAFRGESMRRKGYQATTYHDNYFILAKGIPEMMGWLQPGAKSELLSKKADLKIKLKSVRKERKRAKKAKQRAKLKKELLQAQSKKRVLRIEKRLNKLGLINSLEEYAETSETCDFFKRHYRSWSLSCYKYREDTIQEACEDQDDRFTRRIRRDIRSVCPIAKSYKKEFTSLFNKRDHKDLKVLFKAYKRKNNVSKRTLSQDFSYTQISSYDLREHYEQAEEDIEIAKRKSRGAEVNPWMAGLYAGLQKMDSGKSIGETYQQTNDSVRAILSSARKNKQLMQESNTPHYKKPKPFKSQVVNKSSDKRRKAASIRRQKAACDADGGRYDESRQNCTVVHQSDTVVLANLGVNQVGFNNTPSNASNSSNSNSSSSSNRTQSSSRTDNISKGAKGAKKTIKVGEAFALCWSWDRKGQQKWRCAGPTQLIIGSSNSEQEAMEYTGCKNYRKKYHNLRFTHARVANLNNSKYTRYAYACDKAWYNKYQKRVLDRFDIQWPASSVFKEYDCTKVDEDNWGCR